MITIAKFKILFLLIHTQKMMLTTWDFEESYDPKRPKILVEHNVWYYKDYLKVNDKFLSKSRTNCQFFSSSKNFQTLIVAEDMD